MTKVALPRWLTGPRLMSRDEARKSRAERAMRFGSPTYVYNVGAVAASGYVEFDIENTFPAAQKYAPLDKLKITNNDTVDVTLTFNGTGNSAVIVAAGTIRTFRDDPIYQVRLTNLDAGTAVTANAIRIELQRQPMDADIAARMAV